MIRALLTFLAALIITTTANAQLTGTDIKPGDPCTAAEEGYVARNASADRDASEITLMCNGATWESATGGGLDDNAVTNAKMADDAIGIPELSATGTASGTTYLRGDNTWATPTFSLPALTSSNIWVGDGSNTASAVTMSGDATLSNTGVLNIANNAIIGPEISAGAVTNSHLAGSIALSKISITGTTDGSKFLRDDGSWQAVPSGADNLGNHTATSNLLMGAYQVDYSEAVGDKALWYSNTYGTGVESHTLTHWAATNHRWRIGGTSVSSGTEKMLVNGSALNIFDNAITSSAGTIRDADGGWVRTYGDTGWYNSTHGGGWNMEDTTWLRAYGGKAVYTSNVVRADAGIRTNQICNTSGSGCVAQSSLGGSAAPTCTIRSSAVSTNPTRTCSGGEIMTGGGCELTSVSGMVSDNYPSASNAWSCVANSSVRAYAVCCNF